MLADQPYRVWAQNQCLERTVTPRAQLRALIDEIVPTSMQSTLASGGTFGFEHAGTHGTFDVGVSQEFGTLQVTLAPKTERPTQPNAFPPQSPPATSSHPATPPPSPPPTAPQSIVPAPPYPQPVYPQPVYPQPVYPQPVYPPSSPPNYYPPQAPATVQHVHHYYAPAVQRSPRSRVVAGLLGLFLPGLGIHRFYLGYTGAGVCYLLMLFVFSWLTCGATAWMAGIVGFIEGIVILCGGMNDAEGRPLSF